MTQKVMENWTLDLWLGRKMKKFIYVLIFVFSFIFFFLWTFPADRVIAYYFNKYHIKYESVEGNIFNLTIENIEYQQIIVPKVKIKPFLIGIQLIIPKSNTIKLNLDKTVNISLKKLRLEDFQKKPVVYGNVKGNADIHITKYITAKGEAKILVKNYVPFNMRNIKIHLKMKNKNNKTKINLKIQSQNINGVFDGFALIPSNNIYEGVIEGDFKGKIFGSTSNQHIRLKLGKILRNL